MNYLAACRWDGVNFLFFVVGEFVLSLVVVSDFVDQLIEAIGEGVSVNAIRRCPERCAVDCRFFASSDKR